MDNDLISRSRLRMNFIQAVEDENPELYGEIFLDLIDNALAEERPQGEWVECTKSGMPLTEYGRMAGEKWYGFKCSRCNHIYKGNALIESPYCQKCGADMRKPNCVTCDHFGKCEGCEKGGEE